MTLDEARAVFREWLHLPDTGSLDVVLGTVAANRLDGDPVWMLLVGPPGGGKSEILNAVSRLEDAHPTGTLTEAALLSGTPKRERAQEAKGGLLRAIGDRGIIVCKDFGSVLSMNRDARAHVLAALREVYDGAWTRHVGTDGGKTLHWAGRVGLVGGVTPTIDRHHAVMGAMGERFTFYRLPPIERTSHARRALGHSGREKAMRQELEEAATAAVSQLPPPRERTQAEEDRLVTLASFVATARSAVERDSYSREIELVPEPEAPGRLIIMLARLLDGLDAIGCDRQLGFQHVTKVALDSIPALRLSVLHALQDHGRIDTREIGSAVRHPPTTTRRALEDLTAHGLVECIPQEQGKAHHWELSTWALEQLETAESDLSETLPEMSEPPQDSPKDDISFANQTFPEMSEIEDSSRTTFPEKLTPVVGTTERKGAVSKGEGEIKNEPATVSPPANISGKVNANGYEAVPVAALLDTEPPADVDVYDPATQALLDDDFPSA